jgi:hypothetical protein
MTRVAVLFVAALFAAPLLAQDEVYLDVKQRDTGGESTRYRLDCVDARCTVETKTGKREVGLNDAQQKALLGAVQAEARQFSVGGEPAAGDARTKVKIRYDTPGKRLEIERRLSAEKTADLTPELREVIKAHFELDFSKPASTGTDEEKAAAPSVTSTGAG